MTGAERDDEQVIAEVVGHAGVLTLNRPRAMNALTHGMVRRLREQLERWRDDDAVRLVVLRGAGERGLCAGGDIAVLYRDALEGGTEGAAFWSDEYALNLEISRYPKPYVALMDGVVLGGGVGVSAHGSHRVVTENSRVGMPETGIGFCPDVGGTFLLAGAPHNLGLHLALTAAHVGAAEAVACGLADHEVPAAELDGLVEALAADGDVTVLERFTTAPGTAFDGVAERIGRAYAPVAEAAEGEVVAGVLETLDRLDAAAADGEEWAGKAAERIRRNSPSAVCVAAEAVRRARGRGLAEVLNSEFRVSVNLQRAPDFAEGVRAQLIDKDRDPHWRPGSLEEISDAAVAAAFAPVTDERVTPLHLD